jgi:hypothetical protein
MHIHPPVVRDRLRAIITDFRTQTSLREGCNAILRSDCLHLVQRLQREVRRALPCVWVQRQAAHAGSGSGGAASAAEGGGGEGAAVDGSADKKQQQAAQQPQAVSAAAAAAAGSTGYLPANINGPQWLKYGCSSGKLMVPGSSQDVPAVAVHALAAAAAAAAGAALPLAGPSGGGVVGASISGRSLSTQVRVCGTSLMRGGRSHHHTVVATRGWLLSVAASWVVTACLLAPLHIITRPRCQAQPVLWA